MHKCCCSNNVVFAPTKIRRLINKILFPFLFLYSFFIIQSKENMRFMAKKSMKSIGESRSLSSSNFTVYISGLQLYTCFTFVCLPQSHHTSEQNFRRNENCHLKFFFFVILRCDVIGNHWNVLCGVAIETAPNLVHYCAKFK